MPRLKAAMPRLRVVAAVLMIPALDGLLAEPPAPPQELILPARLRAVMTIVNAEPDGRTQSGKGAVGEILGMNKHDKLQPWVKFPEGEANLVITIRRFTLPDERETLDAAIAIGNVEAVLKAMKKLPAVGDVDVGGERVPIRAAATWMTERAQKLRLVFSSRVVTTNGDPFTQTSRALDILDLTLPYGQAYGTGSLDTAIKVEPDEKGLMSPVNYLIGSVTQPIAQVERQPSEPAR